MKSITFKERDTWMRRVLADSRMTLARRAVLARVALFLRVETGKLPFSWTCLERSLDCSRDSVAKAIGQGLAFGWLARDRDGYQLAWSESARQTHPVCHADSRSATQTQGESASQTSRESATQTVSISEERKALLTESGAAAPNGFEDEHAVAYRAPDGRVVVTAADVAALRSRFTALSPDFDLIGYIRNIDMAKLNKGAGAHERREAIERKLRRSNDLAIERAGETKPNGKPKWTRNDAGVWGQGVHGVDWW